MTSNGHEACRTMTINQMVISPFDKLRVIIQDFCKSLNREIDLQTLVNWAEDMIREADFESKNFELIRDILARIGLANVREFGLTWDDCYNYLHKLGYI